MYVSAHAHSHHQQNINNFLLFQMSLIPSELVQIMHQVILTEIVDSHLAKYT